MSIIVFTSGEYQARVNTRKNEFGEYKVRFYRQGYHMTQGDYFTDDKSDAIGTAQLCLNKLNTEENENA